MLDLLGENRLEMQVLLEDNLETEDRSQPVTLLDFNLGHVH